MSSSIRRLEESLVVAVAAAGLLVACALPLCALLGELAVPGSLETLGTTLGVGRTWVLLLKTLGLALSTTVVALALGVPLGVLFGCCDTWGRSVSLWLHLFPLFLPPFLLALGWFHVLGRSAPLGTVATSRLFFGELGVVFTLALGLCPVVTALTVLGLRGIDPSLEEAARTVASPLRVVTHVLLPLARPSISLGALLVFALAMSEVGVPSFLGVRSYPAAVLTRLAGMDYAPGEAVALMIPLLAVGLVLALAERRLVVTRSHSAFGVRSLGDSSLPLGRARRILSALAWGAALFPLVPILGLAVTARANGIEAATRWIERSMLTSLTGSAMAATVIVILGVVLGHALVRRKPMSRGLDLVALFAFFTPSAVLGLGILSAWNRHETAFVYTSLAVIVIGLSARYLILGVRTIASSFAQTSPHIEEAAAALGSGYLRRLGRIVVPMHARAIGAAWVLALVFCLRDLDTVVVFHPPGLTPLVVRIFTLEANGPEDVVTGLALIHVVTTATVLAAATVLLRPPGRANR